MRTVLALSAFACLTACSSNVAEDEVTATNWKKPRIANADEATAVLDDCKGFAENWTEWLGRRRRSGWQQVQTLPIENGDGVTLASDLCRIEARFQKSMSGSIGTVGRCEIVISVADVNIAKSVKDAFARNLAGTSESEQTLEYIFQVSEEEKLYFRISDSSMDNKKAYISALFEYSNLKFDPAILNKSQ